MDIRKFLATYGRIMALLNNAHGSALVSVGVPQTVAAEIVRVGSEITTKILAEAPDSVNDWGLSDEQIAILLGTGPVGAKFYASRDPVIGPWITTAREKAFKEAAEAQTTEAGSRTSDAPEADADNFASMLQQVFGPNAVVTDDGNGTIAVTMPLNENPGGPTEDQGEDVLGLQPNPPQG